MSRLELAEAIELEVSENPILELLDQEPKEESPEEVVSEETINEKDDVAEWLERYSPSEEYTFQEERERPDYENMVKKHLISGIIYGCSAALQNSIMMNGLSQSG